MTALLSAYQFALEGLPLLRERLLSLARRLELRGTVLLAPEGVNFSLGGSEQSLDAWLMALARRARNR